MRNDDGDVVRMQGMEVIKGGARERDGGVEPMISWRYGLQGSALRVLPVSKECTIQAESSWDMYDENFSSSR